MKESPLIPVSPKSGSVKDSLSTSCTINEKSFVSTIVFYTLKQEFEGLLNDRLGFDIIPGKKKKILLLRKVTRVITEIDT